MKCVDCGNTIDNGYLCESCFRVRLDEKIREGDDIEIQRSPSTA